MRRSRKGRWERPGQLGAFAVLGRKSREGFTERRTLESKGPVGSLSDAAGVQWPDE